MELKVRVFSSTNLSDIPYLVLAHAVTWVQDNPMAFHHMLFTRVIIKTVVGLSLTLQLAKQVT